MKNLFPRFVKAAQPLWKWARLCASHGRCRRSGCVGSHAGVGAAEDIPIKTGKPRAHELIQRIEETRLSGAVQRNELQPPPKEFECMVVTDAPARMSRTEEVHRITENVYKVRRDTSVVDVPTEGCPTPPATPALSEQTDRWTDGWTD